MSCTFAPPDFMENLLMSSAAAHDGHASRRLPGGHAATDDRHEGHRQLRRRPPAARAIFPAVHAQELLGQRDIAMKEVASIVGKAIGKPNSRIHASSFHDAGAGHGPDRACQENRGALIIEMWKAKQCWHAELSPSRGTRKNTTPTTIETFVTEVFAPAYSKHGRQSIAPTWLSLGTHSVGSLQLTL